MKRFQMDQIIKDLDKKMVFIVGPRQVGKTWIAKEIGKKYARVSYLNYDSFEDREIIQTKTWHRNSDLVIFDELHKMAEWKNYLKGIYDTKKEAVQILVTGSARLDTFRKAGDSLAGRFFRHRLLPFSLSEVKQTGNEISIEHFFERGGFPEPFLSISNIDAKRWRSQYIDDLIRTDILDFGHIHNLRAIQIIFELLRRNTGSPVSYASIARDVQLSPTTIMKYIDILEALYIVFKVTPYSRNIARSILKEPKIYFYDTGLVIGDEGKKLENHVAVSLLKNVFARIDCLGESNSLHYLRTKEGKEVDFCLTRDGNIETVIEIKLSDSNLSANLNYFCGKYSLNGLQLVKNIDRERSIHTIDILSAESYLQGLFL
ncbi:MAG: ATP-binding protein [Spirochaetales bacterium]|nr:ATP-binding protein [Spirochaetales bacterium]